MQPLPKISVIIPSYNAEQYLAPALTTIAKQEYPNLEVIIADGGSSDRTRQVAELFGPLVTAFASERDKGQLDGLQKGLRLATGDIFYWLNADDAVAPGAFHYVASVFERHPQTEMLFCDSFAFCAETRMLSVSSTIRGMSFWDHFLYYRQMYSEGVYWRREITASALPVDTDLRLYTDYFLFLNLRWQRKWRWVPKRLGLFREVPGTVQLSQRFKDRAFEKDLIKDRMREKLGMSKEEYAARKKRHWLSFKIRQEIYPKAHSGLRFLGRKLSGDVRRKRLARFLFDEYLVPPPHVWEKLPPDLRHI